MKACLCSFFVQRCLLVLSLISLSLATSGEAQAAKRAVRRAAPAAGGGAVMLSTPEPRTPIEHNNRGVELGIKGLWPDAIREHEIALAADPFNKEFRTNLSAAQLRYGEILFKRGDTYNAMKQLRGALYVDPNNGPADDLLDACIQKTRKDPTNYATRQKMAEDAEVSGDYETAIVEYRKCVKMRDDGPSHYRLGVVLRKAGKVVDAFNELKIAAGRTWAKNDYKDLGACHRTLGDILKEYAYIAKNDGRGTIGLKRLLNSGIEYRRAATINPADGDAVRSLIEVAREAVAINPNSFDNHMMLAGAYQLAGEFERAKMEYEDCWKVNPTSPALPIARKSYYLAVATAAAGQVSPAVVSSVVQKVRDAVQKNPSDPEMLYILGRALESQGNKDDALQAYQAASQINPHIFPDLKQRLNVVGGGGFETVAQKTPAAAPPQAAKARDETAKNLLKYAQIEKQMAGGDLDGAQKELLAIVEQNPKDGRAWLLLGNTSEKKGDFDSAAVNYRQASALNEPGAESALRQINTSRVQPMVQEGDKAAAEGNWVKAAASYREGLSIASNLPSLHRKLAEALRKLGDSKEADREFKKAEELEREGK